METISVQGSTKVPTIHVLPGKTSASAINQIQNLQLTQDQKRVIIEFSWLSFRKEK
jgi:hypothetical protein